MAFLTKTAELQKRLNLALRLIKEALNLFDREGIGQKELKETLTSNGLIHIWGNPVIEHGLSKVCDPLIGFYKIKNVPDLNRGLLIF